MPARFPFLSRPNGSLPVAALIVSGEQARRLVSWPFPPADVVPISGTPKEFTRNAARPTTIFVQTAAQLSIGDPTIHPR
jgi:hypothetical protein